MTPSLWQSGILKLCWLLHYYLPVLITFDYEDIHDNLVVSIEPAQEFELKRLTSSDNEDEVDSSSRLFFRDNLVIDKITGVSIEAQFKCFTYWILFVTTDDAWDNSLHIYALNSDKDIIDEAAFIMSTVSDDFTRLNIIPPCSIAFSFMGDWMMTVFEQPESLQIQTDYPSALNFSNVKRRTLGLKKERYGYFSITRKNNPDPNGAK